MRKLITLQRTQYYKPLKNKRVQKSTTASMVLIRAKMAVVKYSQDDKKSQWNFSFQIRDIPHLYIKYANKKQYINKN